MAKLNNERANEISSNTYGYASRNYETETAFVVNYFNKMASLSIHLPREGAKGDFPQFNYDEGVKAYITPKDAKLIAKRGRKALNKLEEEGTFKGFGIPLKRGLIEILPASELKEKIKSISSDVDDDDICVVIYTEMNDDKTTDKYLVHVFNKDIYVQDYDATTGSYGSEKDNVEFEYFIDAMDSFAISMTNGLVHAIKDDGKYSRRKFERTIYELATSLGVDLSRSSNSNRRPGVAWNSEHGGISTRGNEKVNTEVVSADGENIDDIIKDMIG